MRSLLRVSGPDAEGFLNGLLTQNVAAIGRVGYAALLTPQGKIVADMFIWREAGEFLLDLAADRAEGVARRLAMFKLRAKVEIAPAAAAASADAAADPRLASLPPRRPGEDLDPGPALALGVPDLARDVAPEEIFALEGLLEELNGVDFKKGCFPGQENVSRMKRRATTRRKLCRIAFTGPPPAFGSPIFADAAELGTVRSGLDDVAIALIRLDRAREAVDKGATLMARETPIRLAPPDWLILPETEED
jgi:folate-binding protein YgfZ